MKAVSINAALFFLAIAAIGIAMHLTSTAATATVTQARCIDDCAGETSPFSVSNALATASDTSAAAYLIANIMVDGRPEDIVLPQPGIDHTTVTSVANAANSIATVFKDDDASGPEATFDKRWSKGRKSLCFTSSSLVMGGGYAIYLDGWGQEHDGCGKGALDNLRGQCGDVWYWTCRNWGSGVLLTFYLAGPPRAKCAVDAMWLASPKDEREEGLCCVYLGSQTGSTNTC